MYWVGIWLIKSCYNEVQELITLFFYPPHRYTVYHWSLHQLCVCRGTTNRSITEALDQEGRGHAVCPQLLTVTSSVGGLWSTFDDFVLLVLVDSEGCGLGGDGGHFLTTRMPIVGFLLLLNLVNLIPLCTRNLW